MRLLAWLVVVSALALAIPLAAESHHPELRSVTISGIADDPDHPGTYNLVMACTDDILVYGLDLFVPGNDPGDLYGIYANTIRLGGSGLDHRPYASGGGHMDVHLLEDLGLAYPLMVPRYGPLVVPVQVLDGQPGSPVAARMHVTYAAGPDTECREAGLAGPRSIGLIAPAAGEIRAAADTAVADYNRYLRGIGEGWRLDLVPREASGPEESLAAIRNLTAEGVRHIVGLPEDGSVAVVMDHAARYNTLVMSCCSSASWLAEPDHLFRFVPDETVRAKALAGVMTQEGVRAAVIIHRDDADGRKMTDALAGEMNLRGAVAWKIIPYPTGAVGTDFGRATDAAAEAVRNLVAANGADQVAVVAISHSEMTDLVGSAAGHPDLGGVRWYALGSPVGSEEMIQGDPGRFADTVGLAGVTLSVHQSPLNQEISDRITARMGLPPGSQLNASAYSTYDSILVLGNAMLAAQTANPDELIAAIPHVAAQTYGTLSWDTLDANGDLAAADYTVWRVAGDAWVVAGTFVHVADRLVPPG